MLKLRRPSNLILVGPSQVGKTTLVREMLKRNVYENQTRNIKWCYAYSSEWFLEEPDIEFVHGLPSSYENNSIVVIDDLMHSLDEKIAEIFFCRSHHCNITTILLMQNLFPRSKFARDITLNCHYMILFKNARDVNQIACFGRQIYPKKSKYFLDAYLKATAKPHDYLLIDLHPETEDDYRLRDNLFPDENGIYWFYHPA